MKFMENIIVLENSNEFLSSMITCQYSALVKITNARVWMPFGIIQSETGEILRESLATAYDRPHIHQPELVWNSTVLNQCTNMESLEFPLIQKFVALGFNPDYDNLWHWHLQTLPALFEITEVCGRDVLILFPELRSWQLRSLEILHLSSLSITIGGARNVFSTKHIIVAKSNCWRDFLKVEITNATLNIFKKIKDGVKKLPSRFGRRIFVDRSDASRRKISNNSEVVEFMRTIGFEIINPGSYSYDDQVRIFADAEIVVGPHGAGMTNVCFCSPGTSVLELMASECQRPTMGKLALAVGCIYQTLICETIWTSEERNPTYHADMRVNLIELKLTIASMNM